MQPLCSRTTIFHHFLVLMLGKCALTPCQGFYLNEKSAHSFKFLESLPAKTVFQNVFQRVSENILLKELYISYISLYKFL